MVGAPVGWRAMTAGAPYLVHVDRAKFRSARPIPRDAEAQPCAAGAG